MYYVGLLCSQLKSLVSLWYISRQLQSDIHVFEWGSYGLSGTSYYRTRAPFNLCTIKQLCDRGAKNSILHFSCDVLTYTSSYLNDRNQCYTSTNCWHLVCPEKLFQSVSVFVRDDIQMEWYQSFAQTSLCSSITWSWTKIRDVGVEVIWCY